MTLTSNTFMHLAPFVVEKLWGGSKLASMKSLDTTEKVGETWEVSTLAEGPSLYGLKPLNELIPDLKYLIKFIDTTDHLSVQVHPGDEYAKRVENSSGKTECWFILSAEKKAGIYLGFKDGVTKASFQGAIDHNLDLSQYLRFYPVKAGDFFFVPAGSIHAIGSGVTLAEVQQSSGITYRVWDWNRVDKDGRPRQLDVKKALDVLNFEESANTPDFFKTQKNYLNTSDNDFVAHPDFSVSVYNLDKDEMCLQSLESSKIYSIISLSGDVSLTINGESDKVQKYHAVVIRPGTKGTLSLKGLSSTSVLVVR